MAKYPVGATWQGVDEIGRIGTIWLERRDGKHEMWYWSWCYPDGSYPYPHMDWQPTYRGCRDEIPDFQGIRFKRIK